MKKSESLKKNKDFQIVYQQGTSQANRYLVMYVLKNQCMKNRLGISVSKSREQCGTPQDHQIDKRKLSLK